MRKPIIFFGLLAVAALSGRAAAQENVAKTRIVSAGVFKNGLAIIKREVQLAEPGIYRLDVAPEPIHGTFWVESNCKVEAAVKLRDIDVPFHFGGQRGLQEDWAAAQLTIRLKNGNLPPIVGTVPPKPKEEKGESAQAQFDGVPSSGYLILKTAKGHTYVNPAEIASMDVEGPEDTVKQRRPVLMLKVEKSENKPTVFISYLTHGLGWEPSYLVDITDPKSLSIEMSGVIRNELANFTGTDIKLISGFPSIQFAHVPSPLGPRTNWDQFLTALNTDPRGLQSALVSQAVANNYSANVRVFTPKFGDLSATPAGEGVDLHFQDIGKRSLQEGETLSLSVAKAKADYERIVEWTVSNKEREESEASTEDIWDVLHFKNPFKFPITTGPAMVTDKGQFNGQRTLYWSNTGEETFLKITRSLSVRARGQEREEKLKNAEPEQVRIGSYIYRRVTVQGELKVNNHRKQPVKMLVRRQVTGTILSTEGDPKISLREEGNIRSVNSRQDLVWSFDLGSGAEKTLRYRYNILVRD